MGFVHASQIAIYCTLTTDRNEMIANDMAMKRRIEDQPDAYTAQYVITTASTSQTLIEAGIGLGPVNIEEKLKGEKDMPCNNYPLQERAAFCCL